MPPSSHMALVILLGLIGTAKAQAVEQWYPTVYPYKGIQVCHQGDIFETKWYASGSHSPDEVKSAPDARTPWHLVEIQAAECLAASIPQMLKPGPRVLHSDSTSLSHNIEPPRELFLEQRGNLYDIKDQMLRSFALNPMQPTGYRIKKGELLEISYDYGISPPNIAPEVWIHNIKDHTWAYSGAQKVKLSPGVNRLQATLDGEIYIANFHKPMGHDIKVELFSGGTPMPMFILGKHAPADLDEMFRRYPDAPNTQLVSDKMLITLPTWKAKKYIDDPVGVLLAWDKILDLGREQYGLFETNRDRHRVHFIDESDGTAWMWAWNYRLGAGAEDAIKDVVNSNTLVSSAGWGPWHEFGHLMQMQPMTWHNLTEVTVNLTSLYIQRAFGKTSRLESQGDWERAFSYMNLPAKDFDAEKNLFVKVAMFWQLDLAFGQEFYKALGSWYRDSWKKVPLDSEQKKQLFIQATSIVSGYNLIPFFSQWGISASSSTQTTINALRLKTLDKPIWLNRDSHVQYTYPDLLIEPDERYATLKNGRDGLCLSSGEDGEVNAVLCAPNNVTQLWAIDEEGYLQNRLGQCLTAAGHYNSAAITLTKCDNASQWSYTQDKALKLKGSSYAIDNHGQGIVKLYQHHGRDNQQWNGLKVLETMPLQTFLMNGGAELPDLAGWHLEEGQIRRTTRKGYDNIDPAEGRYFFTGRGSHDAASNAPSDQMSQRLSIAPELQGQEGVRAVLTFKGNSNGKGAYSLVSLGALDQQGRLIGQAIQQQTSITSPKWIDYEVSLPVPTNAHSLEIRLRMVGPFGGTNTMVDAHIDQIELTVSQEQEPVSPNQPPVAHIVASQTHVQGDAVIQLSGLSSQDPDGDQLTYHWNQLSGPQAVLSHPEAAETQVALPDSRETHIYHFQLTVEDAKGGQHHSRIEIRQEPRPITCQNNDPNAATYPAWDKEKVYLSGNLVSHAQLVWQAKYWTKGTPPESSGAWTLKSEGVSPAWSAGKAYNGGEQVSHMGRLWQAKHWVQGAATEPGKSSIWHDMGAYQC